jgi:hypothetical protein
VTLSTLATKILGSPAVESREAWADAAAQIKMSGRFVLMPELMDFVVGHRARDEQEIGLLSSHLQLPHDPCWIEYSALQYAQKRGLDPSLYPKNSGMLFNRGRDGLIRLQYLSEEKDPGGDYLFMYPYRAVYSSNGISLEGIDRAPAVKLDEAFRSKVKSAAHLGIALICLLTAKNAPLRIDPEEDMTKINARRERSGNAILFSAHAVSWDLSRAERRIRQSGEAASSEVRKEAIAHIVRGHVKIRKSGAFWWSPHVRGSLAEHTLQGRDYKVNASKLGSL